MSSVSTDVLQQPASRALQKQWHHSLCRWVQGLMGAGFEAKGG